MPDSYKAIIGLEIHAQLLTKSKIFCPEGAVYGEHPNTQVSVVSLGHPGTLPTINEQCISHAIKVGLATNCSINRFNIFARKNYFYADLPKGYQVSQHNDPICTGGNVKITLTNGTQKNIRIHRIHVEEDSGKSIHDQDVLHSLIDLNRAGIGLIEIVSEADIETAEEASAYVAEIRKLVRYLDICDGNMEEGSLRCDANVSVMKKDATAWGTKVEVKNMNSISNVGRAVKYEIQRQIEVLESGGKIYQQTMTWDAGNSRTVVMREKESSDDYRYFPEPDLQPVVVTDELLERLMLELPELPEALYKRYTEVFGLVHADAATLIEDKDIAKYYDSLVELTDVKIASTWMLGPIKAWINDNAIHIRDFKITPEGIASIAHLVKEGKVNFSMAKDKLFLGMIDSPESKAEELAIKLDLIMENKSDEISAFMDSLLTEFPDKVAAYRAGQKGMLGFFMGKVMEFTKGKANPKEVNELVRKKLEGE